MSMLFYDGMPKTGVPLVGDAVHPKTMRHHHITSSSREHVEDGLQL